MKGLQGDYRDGEGEWRKIPHQGWPVYRWLVSTFTVGRTMKMFCYALL